MFENVIYLSLFYYLCYVNDVPVYISEEQVSEERDLDLNDNEDIRMEDSREGHWGDVSNDGDNKKNIHALR